jgi:hypothetical protein
MRKLIGFLILIGALSACMLKQPVEDVCNKLKKSLPFGDRICGANAGNSLAAKELYTSFVYSMVNMLNIVKSQQELL